MVTVTKICPRQGTAQLWLRMPQSWHNFLSERAREQGCSKAEILRRAFRLTYGDELTQYERSRALSCSVCPDDTSPPNSNHYNQPPYCDGDPWTVAADDFVKNKCSPATRRAYRHALSQFLHFGGKHPSGIRQGDIIGYRHHLEMRNMSSSTIVQHLASISGYYELCRRRGLAADNPANGVERPYVSAYTGATWLSLDKAKLLLAQPDRSTVKGKRDYAILIAISLTSMRCAELCSLKIRDVIHSGERIRLRYIGKGGGDVVREIPSGCWQVIEEYLSASGRHLIRESPVFAAVASGSKKRRAEKPLTTEAVRQMVAGYVREAFGSDVRITPHSLRHTAATLLRANGRELGEIQSFLRHKRAETTRQYLHILETSDAEISESLWEKLTG